MTIRDWRGVDPAVVGELYERERRHWRDALDWDTAWTWATVEQARAARTLPGLVALDAAGRVEGWTFFIAERGTLHIGALVAESSAVTAALLDAALGCAGDEDAAACFILSRAPGLEQALLLRGFDVEPFHYLALTLTPAEGLPADGEVGDAWLDTDAEPASALLAAAYGAGAGVHFAPTGDWKTYLSGLIHQAGCGVFDARMTRVVRGEQRLEALVAVTNLSERTAHVAQVAVHPEQRGRGLASRLVCLAARAAAVDGRSLLTLIVGDRNMAARHVYDAMGFSKRATFVAARREPARARKAS